MEPQMTGNDVPRGDVRCTRQRVLGYHRYGAGQLATIWETVWNDDITTYSMSWSDVEGYECVSRCTDTCPRIDVPS